MLSYEDRPGMVGRIGSILGRHNVNIASMHVGRRTRRGDAIVVLLLDEDGGARGDGGGHQGGGGGFRPPHPARAVTARRGAKRGHAARGARAVRAAPWGGYQTLEKGPGYQVKRLVVEPGHRFSLQKHRHRAEHWAVVAGSPKVT